VIDVVTHDATWFGDRAVLVTCGSVDERVVVAAHLSEVLGSRSVRCGVRSVLVEHPHPNAHLLSDVEAALATLTNVVAPRGAIRRVDGLGLTTIDVSYSGVDLDAVASALGMGVTEVVHAHARQAWRVDIMGFAPGFAYLRPEGALVADWDAVGRRTSPRPSVPAGSVAVAAGMSAVYPAAMPGGWQLIGTTSAMLFDPGSSSRPALLQPGGLVRFTGDA
jgi:allophanate hydrolase subunit 1